MKTGRWGYFAGTERPRPCWAENVFGVRAWPAPVSDCQLSLSLSGLHIYVAQVTSGAEKLSHSRF